MVPIDGTWSEPGLDGGAVGRAFDAVRSRSVGCDLSLVGDDLDGLAALVQDPDAVVRGIRERQRLAGDEAVQEWSALLLVVVVDSVAVREQAEPAALEPQLRAERVGGAADVPADRAGADAAQDDAGLPGLAEDRVEAVDAPDREQVSDRPAADPDDVLAEQQLAGVGGGLGEQREVRQVDRPATERAVHPVQVGLVVAAGGQDEGDAWAFLAGESQRSRHEAGRLEDPQRGVARKPPLVARMRGIGAVTRHEPTGSARRGPCASLWTTPAGPRRDVRE